MNGAFEMAVVGYGMMIPSGPAEVLEASEYLPEPCLAYRCDIAKGNGYVPQRAYRRLGRAQRMAIVTSELAIENIDLTDRAERVAVCLGTGMGELGQTYRFLENMIRNDEAHPMPACFVNSVHNALAAQIAILLPCKGENHTFVHGATSFETALWQARQILKQGRAEYVLACGADEWIDGFVGARVGLGKFRSVPVPMDPMGAGNGAAGPVPGEGSAAFLLGRPESCTSRFAAIRAVRARQRNPLNGGNAADSAVDIVDKTMQNANRSLADVDLVILGANGDPELDDEYREACSALNAHAKRPLVYGVFKHVCGEFATAFAVAVALAVHSIESGGAADNLCILEGAPSGPVESVLVYNRSADGSESACLVAK